MQIIKGRLERGAGQMYDIHCASWCAPAGRAPQPWHGQQAQCRAGRGRAQALRVLPCSPSAGAVVQHGSYSGRMKGALGPPHASCSSNEPEPPSTSVSLLSL